MQNKYSHLSLFIRACIFSATVIVTSAFYSMLSVMALPLPLRIRYPITAAWIKAMLVVCKKVCLIDYHVEGWENVKKIKNGIIMSKHQSAWETFFLSASFNQAASIIKKELLWVPFFGWGLASLAPIAINRKNAHSSMRQIIEKGKQCLEEGRWIIVFPEGTRISPGEVGRYRIGGARLAVETGYPIIPVAHNAGNRWPRRQFIKNPGMIQVVFGPPIDPKGLTPEEVLTKVQNWIEATMLKINGKP